MLEHSPACAFEHLRTVEPEKIQKLENDNIAFPQQLFPIVLPKQHPAGA
jgi:hypothetical protein